MDLDSVASESDGFYALLDALPALVWTARHDGSRPFVNAAWQRYTGKGPAQWEAAIHPDDVPEYMMRWRAAARRNSNFATDYRLWHAASKRYRWITAQASPARISGQEIWIGTTVDIDERKRRELANEFLARAGVVLNQTLDIADTFLQLANLTIGTLCDYFIFYLNDHGNIRRTAWLHRDEAMQAVLEHAVDLGPDPGDPQWIVARVIRDSKSILWKRGEETNWIDTGGSDYERAIAQLDLTSVLTVPVHLGKQAYGAFALARTGSREIFDTIDQDTATQLADRAAIALANADIYEREHRIAFSFQSAALPDEISTRDGIEIDAHYVAAQSEARVGGDWYDTELLPDGRVLVSIGDVSGSGLEAAVVMSMMRTAIRSVAHVYADPATILEAAQGGTERRLKDHFATVFLAVIDPVLGRLTYASAGHVRPLLLVEGSTIELVAEGLPIGTFFDDRRRSETIELPKRCTLVMYTDGLTEGGGDFLPGEEALRTAVQSQAFRERPTARALFESMLPGGGSDDVAILIARISLTEADAAAVRIPLHIQTGHDAARARDTICNALASMNALGPEALENARLIIGELTANVSRHAPGDALAVIDRWHRCPVFHLVDNGQGFRYSNRLPPIFSESGRGLFIASALSRRLEVLPDLEGGSHVIAVLEP